MKPILRTILPVFTLLFLSDQARDQFYQPIALDPGALKFFDPNSAFIAKAEVITETDGKPDVMPVKIAVMGNMTRVEMDITKERGGKSSDQVMAGYFKDMKTAEPAETLSTFYPQ